MCGRFALISSQQEFAGHFLVEDAPELAPRYNIAPTQPVLAVRVGQTGNREATHFAWGLIPSWAKDLSIGQKLINARSETAAEKPAFRTALRRRRCLLPASGFYEWEKRGAAKQPYFIRMAGGGLCAFAGLWEVWNGPDGETLESCTILTTGPNELLAPIHNRMPVILVPADYDKWLDPRQTDSGRVVSLLQPFPAKNMEAYPVSTFVNSPRNDSPGCIELIGRA
jgi:putative SOS response-associated peptidase YedK